MVTPIHTARRCHCDSLLNSLNQATQHRSRTESRPLGRLRQENVVFSAVVAIINMTRYGLSITLEGG